jgi:phosphatidylinositol alpha-1,6-mannosyltransferase
VRVLQINNEFPPLGGGTATVTFEFCRRLREADGISTEVVTSNGFGVSQSDYDELSDCLLTRLPLKQRCIHHASVFDLVRFAASSLRYLAFHPRRASFDITLAWCTVPAGVVAFLLYKVYGLPYIIRVSGPDIPGFERRYRFIYPFLRPILKAVWRSSTSIICKCQEEANRVLGVLPSARVRVIPNGVDTETYHPPAHRLSRSRVSMLCVARLVERKGQRIAIRALAALRMLGVDAALTLVGDGDSRKAYQDLATVLNVDAFVDFRGSVRREEMPDVYRDADIFILPSSAESMSVACLEALASGLPLVLTSGGGTDAFLEHGKNGFSISHDDLDGFVSALSILARDNDLRDAFGKYSRRLAHKFSWSTTTHEMIAALKESVNERNEGSQSSSEEAI